MFGLQSVLERDNASLIVVSVAQRIKFNAKESIGCDIGGPGLSEVKRVGGCVAREGEKMGSRCVLRSDREIYFLKKRENTTKQQTVVSCV